MRNTAFFVAACSACPALMRRTTAKGCLSIVMLLFKLHAAHTMKSTQYHLHSFAPPALASLPPPLFNLISSSLLLSEANFNPGNLKTSQSFSLTTAKPRS